MSKDEFLKTLRKKLDILEESEIEDIISEYDGYIEEKIAKGSTEEEAVKSMGNVDELVRDLLSAYKIKNPEDKKSDAFNNLADGFLRAFDQIIDIFANKSFNEILRFIIELVFIFVIIAVCKIPFEIIESMGKSIFSSFGGGSSRVLGNIWNFVLEFAYLIFAVLLFIKIFESRYLNNYKESGKMEEEKSEKNVKAKEKKIKESKDNIDKSNNSERSFGIIDTLTSICMFFIKMIVFFILIGVVCYIVGIAMGLGLMMYLIIKGVFYLGIYLIIIALFVLGIVAFLFLFNFIFDRKNKFGLLLVISLISFVLLGVGTGICAVEFANMTIIYSDEIENPVMLDYKFPMEDNLVLGHDVRDIIVDETLGEEIKIEYSYNDKYFKIVADPYLNSYGKFKVLHPSYHVNEFKYSKEVIDEFIKDLKNKTIKTDGYTDINIKVYASSSVKEKLLNNQRKYEKIYDYDEIDLEDICEELYDNDLALPDYCNPYILEDEF